MFSKPKMATRLDLAANNNPDFVFMDVDMPIIAASAASRPVEDFVRARTVKIVPDRDRSADDQETIDLGFEAGATQYITKPLNWPLLASPKCDHLSTNVG